MLKVNVRIQPRTVRAKFKNWSFTMMLCINRYENYTRACCKSFQTSGKVLKGCNNQIARYHIYIMFKKHDFKSIKEKVERYGLIVVKADKGNTVVILYKKSYDEKMLTILNDRSKFQSVSEENTLDRLKKFQSFPRYHYK